MFGEDLPLRPELRKFGYAPGNYMGTCRTCEKTVTNIDKRAWCCLPCAEKLFTEETTDKSYFPLRIEFIDNGEGVVVDTPADIPQGRPFKVIECRYNG